MKNKVLSVLLTLCMVLALFPGTAMAADGVNDQTGIATSGDLVYAVREDVQLSALVSAVPANGTVLLSETYALGADTNPVEINKAFTLNLNGQTCAAALNVVENGALTVTGTGSLTGSLTMAAGTYMGELPTGAKTITGGTFDRDVSAYIDSAAYQCVANADGKTWTVSEKPTNSIVEVTPTDPKEETNDEGVTISVSTAEVTTEAFQALEVSNGGVTIKATSSSSTTTKVDKVEVKLPTAAVKNMATGENALEKVDIATDVGNVTMPVEALTKATGEDVTMVVEKKDQPKPMEGEAASVKIATSFSVSLQSGGQNVAVNGLATSIHLSFNFTATGMTSPVLAYMNRVTNAFEKLLNPSYANGIISGYVNHLSEFAVIEDSDVTEPDQPTEPEEPESKKYVVVIDPEEGNVTGSNSEHYRHITVTPAEGNTDGYTNKNLAICITNADKVITMVMVEIPASGVVTVSYNGSFSRVFAKVVSAEKGVPTMFGGGLGYGEYLA